MIITTCDTIPGKALEPIGLVAAAANKVPVVMGRNARIDQCKSIMAELEADMAAAAKSRKADAVIGVRPIAVQGTNLTLVGTAVKFK